MAPKRKATLFDADESPTKRRTRSSGPLVITQPDHPAPRKPTRSSTQRFSDSTTATVPSVIRTYGKQRRIAPPPASDKSSESFKENGRRKAQAHTSESDGDDSEDQLILSPSKTRSSWSITRTKNGTPRVYMHAVEITSPSKGTPKIPQQSNTESPALILRRRELEEQEGESDDPLSSSSPAKKQKLITAQSTSTSPSKKRNTIPHPAESVSAPHLQKTPVVTPHASPSKKIATPHASPNRLPRVLPTHLHSCLNAQKRAILCALQNPPDTNRNHEDDEDEGDDEPPTNDVAFQQLTDLLDGTISRGEGNSCLLLGPRGSGKTRLVERCLSNLPDRPIILRLSGWAQQNDRLAMREIAWQLTQQTGTSFLSSTDTSDSDSDPILEDNEVNPFLDIFSTNSAASAESPLSLPPSSHLPALISVLPTLYRPTIVLLDAFDLFALHARQSLLYCLLDTVQSCRAGAGRKGVAVIGVTSRVDTVNLLEKRVKSRFSGRIVRTAAPRRLKDWLGIVRGILCVEVDEDEQDEEEAVVVEWKAVWEATIGKFLADQVVVDVLNETFSVTRDVRVLSRILTSPILELSPSAPFPSLSQLISTAAIQRSRPRFPFLHTLPYPSTCLLISSIHSQTAGHPFITFEMLHECFRDQVRASTSAPVQVNGGNIGMVGCTREVLMSAFEGLVSARIFVCVTTPSSNIAKEFVRYRCVVERDEVKKAVEKMGQTNLKKWLNKAQ